MGNKSLGKGTGLLLAGLMLAVSLPGCGGRTSAQAEDGDSGPFYDDRVATVRIVMAAEDWEFTQANAGAEEYQKADFWFDDELVSGVAVRPKGQSSLMSVARSGTARMSLKVDFNFFNSARTFNGLKKVNLNNGFSDPTLIREALGYELFEQMGLPTPRTSFVDLWVNDTHLGLYTMVEQVDQTFLEGRFVNATGNLYKPEMQAGSLDWTEADLPEEPNDTDNQNPEVNLGGGSFNEIMEALGQEEPEEGEAVVPGVPQRPFAEIPPGGMPFRDLPTGNITRRNRPFRIMAAEGMPPGGLRPGVVDYLEQMGLKTNENNPDHTALLRLLDVLNNEPEETFPEEIEKVLDVDQVLRFLAVSTVLVHLDNYIGMGHNYYLYEDNGRFTIIPWDLNMCFGTFNSGLDRDGIINFYIDEPTAGPVAQRPLVRLLSYQPYLDTYHGYLEELIAGPFSEDVMDSRIDELAALIRPYVKADELKFYPTGVFERGLAEDIAQGRGAEGGGGMTPIGLKSFVAERVASVRQQLDGERPGSSGDGSGNGGQGMMGGQMGRDGANRPNRLAP